MTALAQLLLCGEPVVNYAENGDDEGVKIHGEPRPPFASWSVRAPPSVEEVSVILQSLMRKLHIGLAMEQQTVEVKFQGEQVGVATPTRRTPPPIRSIAYPIAHLTI